MGTLGVQAVMRMEIGDRSVDEALTLDRTTIENSAEKMRAQLDAFKCGIQIVKVNLKRVDRRGCEDAFNAVNRAIQLVTVS